MKKRSSTLSILAGLFALIILSIYSADIMISPGKVIDAHRDIGKDCFACHSPFTGSTSDKCIECHKVADIGRKTTKGAPISREKKNVAFHQKLVEDDCVACHSDHRGVKAFRPISSFSHQLLQVSVRKQCESCHENPDDSLHRKIRGNCSQCHTVRGWTPATFDHDRYFRLDRDHDADCKVCHVNNNYSRYTCYGCHEHSRSGVRREHLEEGIRDFDNCVECHRSADEDEAERIWKKKRGIRRERDDD